MKRIHNGNLSAEHGSIYDFDEITGSLDARGADTKTAFPKLTTVGGSLDARGADTKTAFPKLTTVGGSLDASGADTKTAFPKLTTVGGSLDASDADTKTAFPKLTTVGGSLDASGADTKTAFPKLTTVGGYLFARGADTKTAFPKLTTVGGSLDARGADGVRANDVNAESLCRLALDKSLATADLIMKDGILARIIRQRGKVYRVRIVGQTSASYLVTDGKYWAHGETLDKARADLISKAAKQRLKHEPLKPDTLITVAHYRAVTGACESGCRQWMQQNGITNEKIKAIDLLPLLVKTNAYGVEAFKKLAAWSTSK